MPQRIDVPGMGIVEFPDGMSDDQISAAIRANMPQQRIPNAPKIVTMPDGASVDFGNLSDDQIRSLIASKFPNETRGASVPPPPPGFEMAQPGYVDNFKQMATEGAGQLARGGAQLMNAWDFARSGAGRNLVPGSPEEAQHRQANRQAVGEVARGFGNAVSGTLETVYSPINAALRTYVGQPVEKATGSKGAGTVAEIATGLLGPTAITRGARALGRALAAKPSAEQIETAARAGFQSPTVSGLEVHQAPAQSWSQTLRADLTSAGLDNINADKTWRVLERLDNAAPAAAVTGNNLASLRQSLANIAKERGPDFQATQDAAAATRALRSLDDFVAGGIRPRDVVAGDPAAAARTWAEARGDYAQFAKIRAADRRQIQAEGNTASAHSGLNYDNTVRQKMRDIATGSAGRGFTGPGEREAVERIVGGTPERNALRLASALLGGGGGMGSVVAAGAGGYATGGWGAAAPIAGVAMRLAQNAMTGRDLDKLNAVLRANSPLARRQGGARQDVARALIGANTPQWLSNAIAAQIPQRLLDSRKETP